jgi:hypothetical protein
MKSLRVLSVACAVALAASCYDSGTDGKKSGGTEKAVGAAKSALTAYVPATTSYYYGNSKPIPKETWEFFQKKLEKASFGEMLGGMFKDAEKGTLEGFGKEFLTAYYAELGKPNGFENLGFSPSMGQAMYGMDLYPVVRYEMADISKLKNLVKDAEKKSEFTLSWQKCGEHDCVVADIPMDDKDAPKFSGAFVFMPQQLAGTLYPTDQKQKYLDHLTGTTMPTKALADTDTMSKIIADNNYTGYGEGFMNLTDMLERGTTELKRLQKASGMPEERMKEMDTCVAFGQSLLSHAPRAVFGVTAMNAGTMKGEFLLETSDALNSHMMGLMDTSTSVTHVKKPLLSFGMQMSMPKLQESLMALSTTLREANTKNACMKERDLKEFDQMSQGLAMGLSMGLKDVKGLYVALTDLKKAEKGNQPDMAIYAGAYANNAPSLIKELGAMAQLPLDKFNLSGDGKKQAFPDGIIPPFMFSKASYALSNERLDVYLAKGAVIEADKAETVETSKPGLWHLAMDGKRYLQMFKEMGMMDDAPQELQEQMKAMDNIVDLMPSMIKETMWADKRGLVTEYDMKW